MVAPSAQIDSLKESCHTNLSFPYHFDSGLPERLPALDQYLRSVRDVDATAALEAQVAAMFGKEAAAWFPTGTMAQGIAARLYAERAGTNRILLHPTSHLILHEEDGYQALHGLDAQEIGAWREAITPEMLSGDAACAIIEIAQRHSGGLAPSWAELQALKERAASLGLPLHMDGARVWSTRPHFDGHSYDQIADGFSTLYVSFYKDIGGLFGAALIGDEKFINDARIWRARMGGLLVDTTVMTADTLRLLDKRIDQMDRFVAKAKELAKAVADIDGVELSPSLPQINMFHILLPCDAETAKGARDTVAEQLGIWLCNGFWSYEAEGRCAMEITVGEKAAAMEPTKFKTAVEALVQAIAAR